jgi:hypothetical protein
MPEARKAARQFVIARDRGGNDERPQDAEEEKAGPQNSAASSALAGSEVYVQQQNK